ncbi:tau-tubulin kinase 1 [Anaeramoeba flamelloides]|uniref:Tau-tubulin kinase 1 n=1 Tax=Anaeramoeba flamelloides TaxID=1746091 RepID=A0ABQ8XQQ5_9EUKA|nr:tau-tubulin kinase 1 [Anaeramoeba flamelloides]
MDVGSVIRKQWEILQKIGHGGFGQIYAAKDLLTQKIVAIKSEKIIPKKQSLKLETLVLNKMQASRYSPRFFYFGKHDNYYYLVMELLGKNLADLRRRTTDKKFSLSTTLLLSIDMISAIEDIHKIGYVHRDIKPSNFVWRPRKGKKVKTKFSRCCLIDFGLARKFRLTDGKLRPPRETAGFRGTARYASITSHKSKELGRVDDLWSLLYVLVECIKGVLPWSNLQEKNEIFQSKLKFQNSKLCEGTHQSFHLFLEHLQGLSFEDPPNYDYLRGLMIECFRDRGFKYGIKYDWEIPKEEQKKPLRKTGKKPPKKNIKKLKNNLNKSENPKNERKISRKDLRKEIQKINEIDLTSIDLKKAVRQNRKEIESVPKRRRSKSIKGRRAVILNGRKPNQKKEPMKNPVNKIVANQKKTVNLKKIETDPEKTRQNMTPIKRNPKRSKKAINLALQKTNSPLSKNKQKLKKTNSSETKNSANLNRKKSPQTKQTNSKIIKKISSLETKEVKKNENDSKIKEIKNNNKIINNEKKTPKKQPKQKNLFDQNEITKQKEKEEQEKEKREKEEKERKEKKEKEKREKEEKERKEKERKEKEEQKRREKEEKAKRKKKKEEKERKEKERKEKEEKEKREKREKERKEKEEKEKREKEEKERKEKEEKEKREKEEKEKKENEKREKEKKERREKEEKKKKKKKKKKKEKKRKEKKKKKKKKRKKGKKRKRKKEKKKKN